MLVYDKQYPKDIFLVKKETYSFYVFLRIKYPKEDFFSAPPKSVPEGEIQEGSNHATAPNISPKTTFFHAWLIK